MHTTLNIKPQPQVSERFLTYYQYFIYLSIKDLNFRYSICNPKYQAWMHFDLLLFPSLTWPGDISPILVTNLRDLHSIEVIPFLTSCYPLNSFWGHIILLSSYYIILLDTGKSLLSFAWLQITLPVSTSSLFPQCLMRWYLVLILRKDIQ